MKVLFAYFSSESNEHSRSLMTFDKFVFKFGEEAVQHVSCRKVFEDAGIELIPAIIARGTRMALSLIHIFHFHFLIRQTAVAHRFIVWKILYLFNCRLDSITACLLYTS